MNGPFATGEDGAQVDHVGVLVEDLAPIVALFGDLLGVEVSELEDLAALGLQVLWVQWGPVAFEFLAPADPDVPAAGRLRRRGPGLDHIAVRVDSVAASLDWCREHDLPLLDEAPRPGAKGTTVAFLDPEAAAGTRIELVEPAADR
jgi:methylmalonyl-CoA/ethylmalonyl-CoA epimerase